MEPFAAYLLETLLDLSMATGGPVRTAILADMLPASERTIRRYARKLEQAGKVTRRSPKTGWLPVLV